MDIYSRSGRCTSSSPACRWWSTTWAWATLSARRLTRGNESRWKHLTLHSTRGTWPSSKTTRGNLSSSRYGNYFPKKETHSEKIHRNFRNLEFLLTSTTLIRKPSKSTEQFCSCQRVIPSWTGWKDFSSFYGATACSHRRSVEIYSWAWITTAAPRDSIIRTVSIWTPSTISGSRSVRWICSDTSAAALCSSGWLGRWVPALIIETAGYRVVSISLFGR